VAIVLFVSLFTRRFEPQDNHYDEQERQQEDHRNKSDAEQGHHRACATAGCSGRNAEIALKRTDAG
jgi:hypothetical protein